MVEEDCQALRYQIITYLLKSGNITSSVSPAVQQFADTAPLPPAIIDDEIKLTKFVFFTNLRIRKGMQAASEFHPNENIFEFSHTLNGTTTTLYVHFSYFEKLNVLNIELISRSRNAYVKIEKNRMVKPTDYHQNPVIRYDFIITCITATNNAFGNTIFGKLDKGLRLDSRNSSEGSSGSSGASTPGGVYLR